MDIRTSLDILEARALKAPVIAQPDKATLLAKVNQTWASLHRIRSASFKPSASISGEIAAEVRNHHSQHDADNADELAFNPAALVRPFDAADVVDEIADRAVKYQFGFGNDELVRLHEEYQKLCAEHFGYDADPTNFVETSQYLSMLDAQEKLIRAMDFFKPSDLQTYEPILRACDALVMASNAPVQTFECPVIEEVRDQLGMLFPVMILMLKAGGGR